MKRKFILIAICITCCLSACASPRRQVETVMGMIPRVLRFYEDNSEFFDILLNVKERLTSSGNLQADPAISSIDYLIAFENDTLGYWIYGSVDLPIRSYILEDNPEYDFFTAEEKDVINNTLSKGEVDQDIISISISKDAIYFKFAKSGFANLWFTSPIKEIDYTFPTDVSEQAAYQHYEYVDDINDNWGIHVYRAGYA